MHSGKVQYVSRAHGFLDWQINGEGQPRIFFQAFDVEGNVELCKGDEVTFNIADKVRRSPSYMHGSSTLCFSFTEVCHMQLFGALTTVVGGPVFKQNPQDSARACSASYGTVDLDPWSSSSSACGHLRSSIKSFLRSACVCRCQGRRLRKPASLTSPSLHAVSTGQRYVTSKYAWAWHNVDDRFCS